jgi:hypothetical protein
VASFPHSQQIGSNFIRDGAEFFTRTHLLHRINAGCANFSDRFQSAEKRATLLSRPKAVELRMLFRAAFWIGVVALLMPRDSDRGGSFGTAYTFAKPAGDCGSCKSASDSLKSAVLDRLAAVRADIQAAERARIAHAD